MRVRIPATFRGSISCYPSRSVRGTPEAPLDGIELVRALNTSGCSGSFLSLRLPHEEGGCKDRTTTSFSILISSYPVCYLRLLQVRRCGSPHTDLGGGWAGAERELAVGDMKPEKRLEQVQPLGGLASGLVDDGERSVSRIPSCPWAGFPEPRSERHWADSSVSRTRRAEGEVLDLGRARRACRLGRR